LQTPRHVAAVALALCFAACGGDGGSDPDAGGSPDASSSAVDAAVDPDAAPGADASPDAVPRSVATSCRYVVPDELGSEGVDYECGDLIVYENRGAPTATIRVHYVRFFSSATSNNATIYLDGGPGGNGNNIVYWLAYADPGLRQGLMADGDFLVIAQRGTTLSMPSLDCDFDCESTGAHLPSYNTAYNADDVDDLRATLGYEKLNVYGISYGSRLGLEVLRRHGDNVRAAVLGGLVPSQTIWPAHIPASFYSALTGLDASCADHGGCAAAFGDLEADFTAAVDTLNQNPISWTYDDQLLSLDGYTFAYSLFTWLYSKSTYQWLPMIISDLADRNTDRIGDTLGALMSGGGSNIAYGMYYSVVCGELFNPPDTGAFDAANTGVPSDIRDMFSGSWFNMLDWCENAWSVGDPLPDLAMPVVSDVPTLLSSGRLDPITPPGFGDTAEASLTNDLHVVFENSGHGASLQSACGQATFLAFFADPSSFPDASCAAQVTTDYMVGTSATAVPIDMRRVQLELDSAPIPPDIRRRL
jgi:pimeloyl-ACP methyl ester carboxylesterase